eukprot:CAMPEP_0170547716 /NCGR_PEP_ID=MMETSP0211-20121228/6067_1 /TAXON_ID=311385 /ORGANISM="Pseudokeronopsis sp., Strain OXSARD2" /LENGTH=175 /DNA_ID=CAMNT_0010852867 /DNA_START=1349 /DNA_END=1876 /DNA_ORIENTATION=+
MDFLEYSLTALPEIIIDYIEQLVLVLLRLMQSKKQTIQDRATDLLAMAEEILTPELLLPQVVNILDSLDGNLSEMKTKVSALEFLSSLLSKCELEFEEMQVESIAGCVGKVLIQHCNQKAIQMPSLASFLALRGKNCDMALKAILKLPPQQFNIIKQLANAYERTLAKQLLEMQG